MRTSDQINEVATALSKAQSEVKNPSFNRVNPHFKSKYADLGEVLSVVRPSLSKYGIALMQMTDFTENGIVLHTRLTHSSGQWIESTYPVSNLGTHQAMGAALTYAKRQALSAIVGVAGEDDTDGEDAKESVEGVKPQAKKPVNKAPQALPPEKSAAALADMLADLMPVDSKIGLQRWAATWRDVKATLTPADSGVVTEAFYKVQAEINDAVNSVAPEGSVA
jgi:hypothetical protein